MGRQDQAPRAFVAACSVIAISLVLLVPPIFADKLTKQVEIDVKFVEIDHLPDRNLKIGRTVADELAKLPAPASNAFPIGNDFGLGQNPSADAVGAKLFPNTSAPNTFNLSGILTEDQVQRILNSLNREKGVNVISAPVVFTPSNQPAKIDTATTYNPHGFQIEMRPVIAGDGTSIQMVITPTPTSAGEVGSPILLGNGQTMLFGGFSDKKKDAPPPTISQLPITRAAMRDRTDVKKDLVIFITPHVVDELSPSSGGYQNGDPIKTDTVGTGETIGHIGDLKFQNMTNGQLIFVIPPFIFESKSGQNQASACPYIQNVELAANGTKIVPVQGICLEQKKPAVGNGVTGELVMNTGDYTAKGLDYHIPAYKVQYALRLETKIYERVGEMAKHDEFKSFPYSDKDEQTKIALQWCTWSNPRIAEITGGAPATKEDMKAVVKKQQKDPVTPATEKKIDKGVDVMWEKIELASAKAKELEPPDQPAPATSNP